MFSHVNSTSVSNNVARFNEKSGVYLKDNATDNVIHNYTITGSEEAITLAGSSINDVIAENVVTGNDVAIEMDPTSQTNFIRPTG